MTFEIINDNALDIIADLGEFDYVITDPPYPIGGKSAMQNTKSILQARTMMAALSETIIFHAFQKVKKKDTFTSWMFCDWRSIGSYYLLFESIGMRRQQCIVWDKVDCGFPHAYPERHELILFSRRPGRMPPGKKEHNIIAEKKISGPKKTHAFEKPPTLVKRMCATFPPGRVLDPFCGTGGLLLGAHRIGWDVVGIDLDAEYCDIARRRLADG